MGTIVEKMNYTKTQVDRLKDLTNETVLENVVNNVEANLLKDNKVLIGVENANLSDGQVRKLVDLGSYEEITAKEIVGKEFNYFKDEHENILSYNKVYGTSAWVDSKITAVYSSEKVEAKPCIYIKRSAIYKWIGIQ